MCYEDKSPNELSYWKINVKTDFNQTLKSESLAVQKATRKCILLRNNMRKWNETDGKVNPAFKEAEKVMRK